MSELESSTWSGPLPLFTSRAAEDYDQKPYYVQEVPARYSEAEILESADSDNDILYQLALLRPRPEFEPTRDPHPWLEPATGSRFLTREAYYSGHERFWAPRDRNRNRILIALRNLVALGTLDAAHLAAACRGLLRNVGYTPAEVEHARRVMSRLAILRPVAA